MKNQYRMWKLLVAGVVLSSTSDNGISFKRKRPNTGVVVEAYVTAPGAVPIDRQIRWLRKITDDLVHSQVGELSTKQLSQTRELMHELAHNPKLISSYCDISCTDECAVTIESLLRRVVAEQKNVAETTRRMKLKNVQQQSIPTEYHSIDSSTTESYVDNQGSINSNIELTVDDYNCVLEGWARSPSASICTAERCEQILGAMIQHGPYPNQQSYIACIKAWKQAMGSTAANSNNKNHRQYNTNDSKRSSKNLDVQQQHQNNDIRTVAPQRAQRLLELMIRSYDANCSERSTLLPNAECFDTVLKMWSRSNSPTAPHEAELVVAIMDKISRTLNIDELRPKRTSLHHVMTAWVNSKPQRPDNDGDDTDSISTENAAPYRVASILDFMNQRASQLGEADIAPDNKSYNIVLNSFIHQTNAEQLQWAANKAHGYVKQIVSNYKNQTTSTLPVVVPDTILFNTAMGLWGKAKAHYTTTKASSKRSIHSYRKARQILDYQIDLYDNYNCIQCKPDVFGFTTVIGCCSSVKYPIEQQEAFHVAYQTFNQLRDMSVNDSLYSQVLRPNHITYGAMLKACTRLLPMDSYKRREVVYDVFTECRNNGHVSDLVLSWLRDATTSMDDYNNLIQGHTRKTIPYSWSVNVHGKSQQNHHQQQQQHSQNRHKRSNGNSHYSSQHHKNHNPQQQDNPLRP
jgi:hypothetical protein